MSKWIKVTTVVLLAIALGVTITGIVFHTRNNYEYIELERPIKQTYINWLNRQTATTQYQMSKPEVREALEEEMDFHTYIYSEGQARNGGLSLALIRYIRVDADNCDVEYYCYTLCHEMCHINYFTGNEIYTNFMTFKTLYESENEELKQIGAIFGIYVLNGMFNQDYDCSYYIVQYIMNNFGIFA